MRYNPSTDQAQLLDELAAQTKAVITKLVPPRPRNVVWDVCLGRYVDNSAAVLTYAGLPPAVIADLQLAALA